MSSSVGAIHVDVKANTKPFEQSMGGLGGIAKKVGAAIATALVSKAALDFGKQCVQLASDLNEVQNVVDVTFSHMGSKMDEWAAGAATQFGLSETMAKRYAGTFGAMARAFGFTEAQAYDMSTALTGLAGDVASFYNLSQDEAYSKLKSVFSGETESLKQLGVVMTQAALDEYALANGFGKTTSAMTEQEKVSLRLAFVQNALSGAAGDFARTSGSWANQTKLLSLQFESLKATLGQSMIAALLPVVRALNSIMAAAIGAARAFNRFVEAVTGRSMGELTGGATQAGAAIAQTGSNAADAGSSLGGLTNAQNAAAKAAGSQAKAQEALNRALAGFDKINRLTSDSTSTGGGGAGTGGMDVLGGGIADVADGIDATADKVDKLKGKLDLLSLPASLLTAIGHAKEAFGGFFELCKGAGAWVVENVLRPLGEWTMQEVAPRAVELVASAFDMLTAALSALKPIWDFLFEHVVKPFAELVGNSLLSTLDGLDGAFDAITAVINDYVAPAIEALCGFLEGTLGPVLDTATGWLIDGIKGAFELAGGKATWFWENVLVPLGEFLGGAFTLALEGASGLVGGFTTAWNTLKDAAQWVLENLLQPIADFLTGNFGEAVEGASGALDGIAEAWGGVKEFGAKLVLTPMQAASDVAGWFGDITSPWVDKISGLFAENKTTEGDVTGWRDKVAGWWSGTPIAKLGAWATLKTTQKNVNSWRTTVSGWWSGTPLARLLGVDSKLATTKKTVSGWRTSVSDWWSKTKLSRKLAVDSRLATSQKTVSGWRTSVSDWWSKNPLGRLLGLYSENRTTEGGVDWERGQVSKWWTKGIEKAALIAKNVTTEDDVATMRKKLLKEWYGKTAYLSMAVSTSGSGVSATVGATRMASGAWVERNTPRLAIVGDNRHEGEIVSPESKFQTMLDRAAGTGGAEELLPVLTQILAAINGLDTATYLDGQAITRAVVSNVNAQTRATGRSAIIV